MSLRDVHGGRALVLRLILAEVVAKPGEGPLAPRFFPSPSARRAEAAAKLFESSRVASKEAK